MRWVLKLPAYRRLFAAYVLNELTWAIGSLSLAVVVYRRTGSAFGATAFFLCSQFVPALLSPLLVARLDQRAAGRVLPALYAVEACLYLALAGVVSHFSLAPVLVLTLADGIVAMAARSLARAASVAVTSPAGLLREGNALTNAAFAVCFMAGPALGGAIVVAGGTIAALLTNSGLFVVIALTLVGARGLPGPVEQPARAGGRLREALSWVRRTPAVRLLLALQAGGIVFFTISIPVEVVLAQHTLHAGAAGYAALLTAWGAGAVAGSAAFGRFRRAPARTLIAVGAGSLGLGFLAMATAPSLAVAIVGAGLGGAGNGVETVAVRTALQEHVDPERMALVVSVSESIYEAMPGAGILLGGAITALAGARTALAVAGIGCLGVAGAVWVGLRAGARKPPAPMRSGTGARGGAKAGSGDAASA